MFFKNLKLINFKGYENASVSFHPQLNCIVGQNGAGKTNLMDALYYSCFTKSYFSNSDQFVVKENTDFFRIECNLKADDKDCSIVIKAPGVGRKSLELNHVEIIKRTDFIGQFPAVMIAPDDNQIILGSSDLRRKFMSACIGQYNPDYLEVLLPYQKLVRQRNAALKEFRKKGRIDETLLTVLDEQMISLGALLFEYRKEFIKAFKPIFSEVHGNLVHNAEQVDIEYQSQLDVHSMENGLKVNKKKDLLTARSNFGPHKDDLDFLINGQPLKAVGSQGQQKSFLVSLKIAQYEIIKEKTRKLPFLFLDDLFDKFDETRVVKLIELIQQGSFGQVFITDTHEYRIESLLKLHNLEHQLIIVDKGNIGYGNKG
ncbi:MAG: DNA replication and repair protein RecF [Chitinophagales bacterium]